MNYNWVWFDTRIGAMSCYVIVTIICSCCSCLAPTVAINSSVNHSMSEGCAFNVSDLSCFAGYFNLVGCYFSA